MSERALRHDDHALAADGVHERLCDRGAHELVVGSKEREDVDLIERRDQRVHVNSGIPASIILTTGAVIVSMSTAWMATKFHFSDAISSTRASCFAADSSGANQVTSTLNSRPQYSAASFPCAHQVTCRPMFENAARSRLREG